ncbi:MULTISPECIES: ATP-binding cassette domain-containing protein [unclassified Burkholderia]|uniref:ATP-binding cassette domain-containing protein n=1 Tax=unclassified Burkholderia TaxID=2613784 RepID=UPI002AB130FA|nr:MULTISPECIES: ATP-binding cassette domain-containing protein [unclassified Burkholderia]
MNESVCNDARAVVLRLSDVSKTYPGVRALDHVSIECRAGEIHAILGENGSGKSTLMKIASGAVKPDSGTVHIGGSLLAVSDPRAARELGLATVYQDDSLILELTVAENLLLAAGGLNVSYQDLMPWAEAELRPYGVDISPADIVADLTPAQRQFVEIVKALQSKPRVLILDEPTSTLDLAGVKKLNDVLQDVTACGTGVIYISHRLPEILELAERVTILRDGVYRGTYPVRPDMEESELVTLMVGRDIEAAQMETRKSHSTQELLRIRDLSGDGFHKVSYDVYLGEIVGLAGAEGNGQREALRALVGLDSRTDGYVECGGRVVDTSSPAVALRGGILYLSADRKGEAMFPELGVRKNMVLPILGRFLRFGVLRAAAEIGYGEAMRRDFGVAAANLNAPIRGLSGGNQQKAMLARCFRSGARAVLLDEPTQGVDAGARYEIYGAIQENIRENGCCVINSSDAQELATICDRVLVFSRGRIIKELAGEDVTEERIVTSFLTARGSEVIGDSGRLEPENDRDRYATLKKRFANGSADAILPIVLLTILSFLVSAYAAGESEVFLKGINIRHLLYALTPTGLVAMAQLNVLIVRGIDISVGSVMSLIVVLASYVVAQGGTSLEISAGVLACLVAGLVIGLVNGAVIRFVQVNAIITTIASLSILQGFALVGRPIPGGLISSDLADLLRSHIDFIPVSCIVLIVLAICFDFWLHRTRSGLEVKATGFREEAARRNGARVTWIHIRAYIVCAFLSACAGIFLGAEVGVGHPTVGQNYALTSVAASVLGGAALSGGRGSFSGALLGAFFFTLIVNVISILGLSSATGLIAGGAMTLTAVFLYSGNRNVMRFLTARSACAGKAERFLSQ